MQTCSTSSAATLPCPVNSSRQSPVKAFQESVGLFLQRCRSKGRLDTSQSELDTSVDKSSDYSSYGSNSFSQHDSYHDSDSRLHLRNDHCEVCTLVTKTFSVGFIDTHCHLDFLFKRIHHKGTLSDFMTKMSRKSSLLMRFPSSFEGCIAIFCQPDSFHKVCDNFIVH